MLFSVEQAFVGRDETRPPLETPAWEAKEKTNNKLNPHMASILGFEPGHIVGRLVLTPLPHPCFPKCITSFHKC